MSGHPINMIYRSLTVVFASWAALKVSDLINFERDGVAMST